VSNIAVSRGTVNDEGDWLTYGKGKIEQGISDDASRGSKYVG
jgi:hypothetical protein